MSETPFSVRGKRVVVVGAARSGIAAAELLVRRGATVTLTDLREQIDDEERLRAAGVSLELGEVLSRRRDVQEIAHATASACSGNSRRFSPLCWASP